MYTIDPSHTWVVYEIVHVGTSTNRGRLAVKSGSVELDAKSKVGRVDVQIDTSAPSTGVPALDRMMQGERLFRSAEHPSARYTSTQVRFEGGKPVELVGDLTLLGVTRPVTLKSTRYNCYQHNMLKREVCGGDFETTIQRSAWGMSWGQNFVADEVRLLIQVEAIRQSADAAQGAASAGRP